MKVNSSLKKNKRHEEYEKDNEHDEDNERNEPEDSNDIIEKQTKVFSFNELFNFRKNWQLDNYVSHFVLDEYRNDNFEEYEIYIKMHKKYLKNKETVFREIKKVISDGDPNKRIERIETNDWLRDVYKGPKRGNAIQDGIFEKKISELKK